MGDSPYSYAASKTGLEDDEDQSETYFRLNEALAFEDEIPPYLRTGTIFQVPGENVLGVCVTPECDLVPRMDKIAPPRFAPTATTPTPKVEPVPGSPPRTPEGAAGGASATASVVLWRPVKYVLWAEKRAECLKHLGDAESLNYLFLRLGKAAEKAVLTLGASSRKPRLRRS